MPGKALTSTVFVRKELARSRELLLTGKLLNDKLRFVDKLSSL
jgi:hypothetical protein